MIIKLEKANDGIKKWKATFLDGTITNFGSYNMNDYTLTGDKNARRLYKLRHKKDLDTGDPHRAGYLSYYILWGDSTDIFININNYNKMFF